MSLPPGPRLPVLAQTLLFLLRPIEFLDWCHRRYGDCFVLNTLLFGREVEVVHPDLVRQVFTGDPDVLRAGEANAILGPLVGDRSVLLLDGVEHVRQRKLLMPPFHGERVAAYGITMHEIAERAIDAWPQGSPFALYPHMQRITLEIILRTVFGVEEGSQLGDLRDALTRVLNRLSKPVAALLTAPPFRRTLFGLTPWDGFLRDLKHADTLILRQIDRRRADARRRGAVQKDVLAMLLAARDESPPQGGGATKQGEPMTDGELRDELMTLLVAGHETTATMLCWFFELVLTHTVVHDRLLRELYDVGADAQDPDLAALARLPFLDATIKEVLRLRPVIPAVGRRLKEPLTIGSFQIPAGELVVPASILTHRMPGLYPDPDAFKPERFLDSKPDPYAWYPFGGGARRCLGMAFSLYEMKVVVASVLTRTRLQKRHPEPAPVSLRGFTLVPKGGTQVILRERLSRRAKASPPQSGGATTTTTEKARGAA
jgi:cytochrome P450